MKAHLDGFYFDAAGSCKPKCLTFSLGAPFGSGPPQAPGTVISSSSSRRTAAGAGSNELQQRWIWVFFYRDLEGHHLQSVGLEFRIDASGGAASLALPVSSSFPAAACHSSSSSSLLEATRSVSSCYVPLQYTT
jgi:hypothetical protein